MQSVVETILVGNEAFLDKFLQYDCISGIPSIVLFCAYNLKNFCGRQRLRSVSCKVDLTNVNQLSLKIRMANLHFRASVRRSVDRL